MEITQETKYCIDFFGELSEEIWYGIEFNSDCKMTGLSKENLRELLQMLKGILD
jgi:hypothetical protein